MLELGRGVVMMREIGREEGRLKERRIRPLRRSSLRLMSSDVGAGMLGLRGGEGLVGLFVFFN